MFLAPVGSNSLVEIEKKLRTGSLVSCTEFTGKVVIIEIYALIRFFQVLCSETFSRFLCLRNKNEFLAKNLNLLNDLKTYKSKTLEPVIDTYLSTTSGITAT